MNILLGSKIADLLKKANDAIAKFWWLILAVAVLLCIILFIVIACKNKRIRKLKDELKKTRTKLEIERTRAKNEQIFAPVMGGNASEQQSSSASSAPEPEEPSFMTRELEPAPEDDTVTEEIDNAPEPEEPFKKKKAASSIDEEIERAASRVSYYNKTSVVSQKDGAVKFTVKYDRVKDTWVIKKDGVDRVVRRVDTKEEAMNVARALCKKYNASLVVHKKDGKFQRQ